MKFTTKSGSTYELDTKQKQIRRVEGKHANLHGTDGIWEVYAEISNPIVGEQVFIIWSTGSNSPTTITTKVVSLV